MHIHIIYNMMVRRGLPNQQGAPSWPLQRTAGRKSVAVAGAGSLSLYRPSSDRPPGFPGHNKPATNPMLEIVIGYTWITLYSDPQKFELIMRKVKSQSVYCRTVTTPKNSGLKLRLLQLSMLKQRGQVKGSHVLHGHSLQKVACMAKNALAQATRDQADRLDPCLCDIMSCLLGIISQNGQSRSI